MGSQSVRGSGRSRWREHPASSRIPLLLALVGLGLMVGLIQRPAAAGNALLWVLVGLAWLAGISSSWSA